MHPFLKELLLCSLNFIPVSNCMGSSLHSFNVVGIY